MRAQSRLLGVAPALLAGALCLGCVSTRGAITPIDWQQHPPAAFEVDGQPLCFAGSNNYYPIYQPKPVVDDLFQSAHALGLKVMRVWGMLDRGSLDGSVPSVDGDGSKDGVYFQYWDPKAARPAYNDGPDGLERLDYVLAAAAANHVKLIVVLVNNWRPFGGIDQYLAWYGKRRHDEFFSAPELRRAYRDWVTHVILRRNSVNGLLYRDDPTVFAWELANEPRCEGEASASGPRHFRTSTLTRWAEEMSGFIKSLDPHHLVSVGDEGFLNRGGKSFAYRAEGGVDNAALTALPSVDFGTFHLYPRAWGTGAGFAERWIADHLELGRALGKPSLLEEYGLELERSATGVASPESLAQRRDAYAHWNDLVLQGGGSGALAWMLAGRAASGERYPDYDHFAFYRDDATGQLLSHYARAFAHAPACAALRGEPHQRSPFVRVARRAQTLALGWLEPAEQ